MKIYTKTGDKGETGIIGKRISKTSQLINTIGTLDELNATIGLAISFLDTILFKREIEQLTNIQSYIFNLGAILANSKSEHNFKKSTQILEKEIDSITKILPQLQNFILPGGSRPAGYVHFARSVCRRAEREFFMINEITKKDKDLGIFLNRLSDYLFVLARYINFKLGYEDIKWQNKK